MLTVGSPMYLLIPDESNERTLVPGKVLESDAETFVAEFEQPAAPAVGADVNAFAEFGGKFYQQGAVVAALRQAEPSPIIAFRRVGTPASAESRSTYRVCTASAGMVVRIGNEDACSVVDVSPEGFAALTKHVLRIGALVNIRIQFENQLLEGQARVQGVRNLPSGKFRYGFLALDGNNRMRRGLEQITAAVQRLHLRRMARTA